MANFNGTQVADTISGTNDDDIITGLGGADTINGAGGNDNIDGGAAADDIIGGDGDDTIDGGAAADIVDGEEGSDTFAGPDNAGDTITGGVDADGDDIDTLVADLADGEDLTFGAGDIVNGVTMTGATITGIEQVQVSNANDFIIDLTSTDYGATASTDIDGATYMGAGADPDDIVADGTLTFVEAEGVVINGTTYASGDTYTTATGGTVAILFNAGEWEFTYTASQQSTINAGAAIEDEVLAVQMTEAASGDDNVVDAQVTLISNITTTVNLTGETDDFTVNGSGGADALTSGDGDDTLFGGDGADTIVLNEGDNRVWAGAGDTGNDTITANGDGDNIVAGGAGVDDITLAGDGDNQAWAGAGDDDDIQVTGAGDNIVGGGAGQDEVLVAGDGDNQVWGGAGDDNTSTNYAGLQVTGDGMNTVGGGDGQDLITIDGDGANTIFGGADAVNDTIVLNGNGNNTVFGGGTAGTNTITVSGTGANTVYNGGGDDIVQVADAATGANMLYAGAGDDRFDFDAGNDQTSDAAATIIFGAGSGNDTIDGLTDGVYGAGGVTGDVILDLSDLGFADADDVLDSITDNGTHSVLFITAGQTVTFENTALTTLQAADPDDWLIL